MFLRKDLSDDSAYKVLTPRETEVLQCIWDGLHSEAISERLELSRKGVEYHRLNIVRNWGCVIMMQVIRLALGRGILEV